MDEDIKEVIIKYVSGREERLNVVEASDILAGKRQDWISGKTDLILLVDQADPFLKIYRNGKSFIFESNDGIKEFENRDNIREDRYYDKLFELYLK